MKNKKPEKFWNVEMKADRTGDLYISNSISSYAYEGYTDSAKSIRKDLENLGDIETLNVYINSPGGSVTEGTAIHNMLKRKAKNDHITVNAYIDFAASIATIICMAADNVYINEGAMFMVHRASMGTYGNIDSMKEAVEVLEKIDANMLDIYMNRTGLDSATLKKLLKGKNNDGTWLTAKEAVEYGFCDSVTEFEEEAVAMWDDEAIENFDNLTEDVQRFLNECGKKKEKKCESDTDEEKKKEEETEPEKEPEKEKEKEKEKSGKEDDKKEKKCESDNSLAEDQLFLIQLNQRMKSYEEKEKLKRLFESQE